MKNLVVHDNGNTFKTILHELEKLGYYIKYKVLNAIYYGNIPQNRERIYIVAFQNENENEYNAFQFPQPIQLTRTLSNVIDYGSQENKKYYYTDSTCNFFPALQQNMKRHDTIYQWRRIYVRENQNNVCPTLTANMGTGGIMFPLYLQRIRDIESLHLMNVSVFKVFQKILYCLPILPIHNYINKLAIVSLSQLLDE